MYNKRNDIMHRAGKQCGFMHLSFTCISSHSETVYIYLTHVPCTTLAFSSARIAG